jgi:dTDP-4-dehydrorhamnose 3,5-epimerase
MSLEGVNVRDLVRRPDERGYFAEILRSDWSDFTLGETPVQANLSMSYPGIVRAWHRHARGQVDYFVVVQGALKICAYDDRPGSPHRGELVERVASADHLQVVRIPGEYWHGTMAVGIGPAMAVYLVSRLYDAAHPDEERRPWNDPTIRDPSTGAPYDWHRPPHK